MPSELVIPPFPLPPKPPYTAAQKLAHARWLVARAVAASSTRDLIIMLSYGKDSLACLDLAAPIVKAAGGRLFALFMYLVKDLRCIAECERGCRARYDYTPLHLPHWMLFHHYQAATLRPFLVQASVAPRVTLPDMERHARKALGTDAFVTYGQRKADSLERRAMLNSFGKMRLRRDGKLVKGADGACVMVPDPAAAGSTSCFDTKGRRVYPIGEWSTAEVVAYNRIHKLPRPPRLGDTKVSGVTLRPDALAAIKAHYPDDFERILAKFPYADALLKKREFASAEAKRCGPTMTSEQKVKAGYGDALLPASDEEE